MVREEERRRHHVEKEKMKALKKKNEEMIQKIKASYGQVLKWTTIELDYERDEILFSYPFAGKSSNNHGITSKLATLSLTNEVLSVAPFQLINCLINPPSQLANDDSLSLSIIPCLAAAIIATN